MSRRKILSTLVCDLGLPTQDFMRSRRTFRGVVSALGKLWAFGVEVLLVSEDGRSWRDISLMLAFHDAFVVNTVLESEDSLLVFAYSRDTLHCFQIDSSLRSCTSFSSLRSSSPRSLPAHSQGGFVICTNEGSGAEFWRFREASSTWEKLPAKLAGVATFLDVQETGDGLCALWGVTISDGVALPSPSLIYRTSNFGESWSVVRQVNSMLLCGATARGRPALLGGTDGFVAEAEGADFVEIYGPTTGDVCALCSQDSQQAAIVASLEEPPDQTLIWRARAESWQLFGLGPMERIQGITFIRFGVLLLCTQSQIFVGRLELLH